MSKRSKLDLIASSIDEAEPGEPAPAPAPPMKFLGGHKPTPRMPVIAKRDWTWNVDTFRYPWRGVKRAIFCAVEMTSRRAFVHDYGTSDPTADGTLEALDALKENYTVNAIQADLGSEFNNDAVREWCSEHGVEDLRFSQAGVKQEASMVESFNSTLRSILDTTVAKAEAAKRQPNWLPNLNSLVAAYNASPNRTIKMAPDDVAEADMGLLRVILKSKGDKYLSVLDKFQPGQTVRVWSAVDPRKSAADLAKETFRKGRKFWMPHIFTVVEQSGYKIVVRDKSQVYERRLSPRDLLITEGVEEGSESENEDEETNQNMLEAKVRRGTGLERSASETKADLIVAKQPEPEIRVSSRPRRAVKVVEPDEPKPRQRKPRMPNVGKKPPKSRKEPKETSVVLPQFYSVEAITDWEINDGIEEGKAPVKPFFEFLVKYAHRSEPEYQPASNFYIYDAANAAWGWESHAYEFVEKTKDTNGKPLWWLLEEYVPPRKGPPS